MRNAINNASPKLEISNKSPIILSVIINVSALITNKNNPNEMIVIGKVKIIKIGRTRIFNMDRTKLAPSAAPKPSTSKPGKYPANDKNNTALMTIPKSHFI